MKSAMIHPSAIKMIRIGLTALTFTSASQDHGVAAFKVQASGCAITRFVGYRPLAAQCD
jgi:hypothetical protein